MYNSFVCVPLTPKGEICRPAVEFILKANKEQGITGITANCL